MPPKPRLNGGLYTGEPFAPGAPWGNVPITPDAGYMSSVALRTANPPPGAKYHFGGGGLRPGNNTPFLPLEMVGAQRVPGLNMVCTPNDPKPFANSPINRGFAGHAYL